MKIPHLFLACIPVAVAACASSGMPRRISDVVAELKCGMKIADVEGIAKSKLLDEGQRTWGNRMLQLGSTDVWLQFDSGKLVAVQVATLDGLMKMKLWPRKELCI